MFGGGREGFDADDAFEDCGGLGVVFCGGGDDAGAVDEVDAAGECDVLPDLHTTPELVSIGPV